MTRTRQPHTILASRWLLLGSLAALVLCVPTGLGELNTAPTRFDLPAQDPGDTITEDLFVKNRGDESVDVNVTVETVHREAVSVTPSNFTLDGGGNETLTIEVTLPENATGGRHDIRLRLLEQVPASEEGELTVRDATLVPMVFNVRNLAVANVRLGSAGDEALPVETVVRNGLHSPVNASLELRLATEGSLVSELTVPTGPLTDNETHVVRTDVPVDRLSPGEYQLEATAIHEANRSNTWTRSLQLGAEHLRIVDLRADPGGDEATRFTAQIANDAPVGLDVDVTFTVHQNGSRVDQIPSTTHTIPPGTHANVSVERSLDPGEYQIEASGGWPGAEDGSIITMREPDDEGWFPIPGGQATLVAALAVGAILLRREPIR